MFPRSNTFMLIIFTGSKRKRTEPHMLIIIYELYFTSSKYVHPFLISLTQPDL